MPDATQDWARLAGIALGGALGAMTRYQVGLWVTARVGPGFPWGTLIINVSGSFLLGLLAALAAGRLPSLRPWYPLAAIGFLGAYTTFSTFSVDALNLLMGGGHARAAAYVLGSVFLSLAAAWGGILLGRLL